MRKIILYIAQSIDGFIARPDGDVSWLEEVPNPEKSDYGYAEFIASIDTVIMGKTTFDQLLGFDIPYPYADKKCFVFTRNKNLPPNEHADYVSSDHLAFIEKLKSSTGKPMWLIGGGATNSFFMKNQLIDEIRLFIMPVVLGNGKPLFQGETQFTSFELFHSERFRSGVMELQYRLI